MDETHNSGIRNTPQPFDYESRVKEAVRKNQADVVKLFNELSLASMKTQQDQLYKRLETYAKNVEHPLEEIYQIAKTTPAFAKNFALDPKKQNIYEDLAYGRILNMDAVSNPYRPPAGGKNSLVIEKSSRKLMLRSKVAKGSPTTKSVDFVWQAGGALWFASHKYTLEGGGAQDNQFKDLCTYLEYSPHDAPKIDPETFAYSEEGLPAYFVALADGAYYNNTGASKIKRIDEIKAYSNGSTKFACPVDDLEKLFERVRGF